jgi:hypothetical protein
MKCSDAAAAGMKLVYRREIIDGHRPIVCRNSTPLRIAAEIAV